MLDTAEKMYRYFLIQVRKAHTVVISPTRWNEFINPVALDWVKMKLPELEFNQKRIDDLEAIKVLTDGIQYNKIDSNLDNTFDIPYNALGWPKYLHGLSVQFSYQMAKTLYGAKILRSDVRAFIRKNPYRKPRAGNLIYYEHRGGKIYPYWELDLPMNQLILEYYSYPDEIKYDPSDTGNIIDLPGSFKPTQNKEIMDLGVTKFLENVSDPRIQTQPSVQVPS